MAIGFTIIPIEVVYCEIVAGQKPNTFAVKAAMTIEQCAALQNLLAQAEGKAPGKLKVEDLQCKCEVNVDFVKPSNSLTEDGKTWKSSLTMNEALDELKRWVDELESRADAMTDGYNLDAKEYWRHQRELESRLAAMEAEPRKLGKDRTDLLFQEAFAKFVVLEARLNSQRELIDRTRSDVSSVWHGQVPICDRLEQLEAGRHTHPEPCDKPAPQPKRWEAVHTFSDCGGHTADVIEVHGDKIVADIGRSDAILICAAHNASIPWPDGEEE